ARRSHRTRGWPPLGRCRWPCATDCASHRARGRRMPGTLALVPAGIVEELVGVQALESRLVFTVEQRDALRERLLQLAEDDERVIAGAAVGSLAVDNGDRFSDLDLTFGIADGVLVPDVLSDWTRRLVDELDAVHLTDLERGPTTYGVFLLPDELQCDLSMTPAAQFRPAGPRFRLLFGETARGEPE